ncbi:hypothetical protein ASE08_12030 [Rhizobacter sp. Root16D2]|nr:hypothetical protein ASC88_15785 [Rhizobacter sp. Root29]KQW04533.1 hypothetical protein ASC98_05475 [Rhizobacter sp. Root1238]KRB06375.1 hypothetical protein ASE08_12030 [Rhizobacter sp. Root16D2]
MVAAPWAGISRLVIGIVAMSVMAPAFATRQCPPEFGKKSDGFMAVGWSLLLLALVAGVALMYLVVKRTRGWKLRHRLPALLLGVAAMLAVWTGGLAIFFGGFVFVC